LAQGIAASLSISPAAHGDPLALGDQALDAGELLGVALAGPLEAKAAAELDPLRLGHG
jgi:hypothetical protein